MREDVGLNDVDLSNISTKELNKLLKKKGISKARQKEIKKERRTLKNRRVCMGFDCIWVFLVPTKDLHS